MGNSQYQLKMHENNTLHFPKFLELNRRWIEQFFQMEPCDWALEQEIEERAKGGELFFTVTAQQIDATLSGISDDRDLNEGSREITSDASGEVVGACALFASKGNGKSEFELARMAVDPNFHGQGIGKMLIQHVLSRAAEMKAKRVYLMTNTMLEVAVSLYQMYGFQECLVGPQPNYGRCNLVMEKHL